MPFAHMCFDVLNSARVEGISGFWCLIVSKFDVYSFMVAYLYCKA